MSFLQDIVAGEYHLDVLGINLQVGRKNVKKIICVSPPRKRGGRKNRNFGTVPETRGQGTPGPAGYHTSQIRPRSIQIRPVLWLKSSQGGQKCCGANFGSRKKISGHPLGQSAWIFEIYLVAAARTPKIRKKKLPFLSCLFLKGTPMANSYTPYKRPAPICAANYKVLPHPAIPTLRQPCLSMVIFGAENLGQGLSARLPKIAF